jgi:hypothetical protein
MIMKLSHYIVAAAVVLYFSVSAQNSFAQGLTPSDSSIAALNDTWNGTWVNAIGHIYIAELHLKVSVDGTITGKIDWTLQKSPREAEQSKLGLTGVEYVSGKYDAASRVLSFDGYSKDDPNIILGLDRYKLLLAENNSVIGGITYNNGSWLGIFSLTRKTR